MLNYECCVATGRANDWVVKRSEHVNYLATGTAKMLNYGASGPQRRQTESERKKQTESERRRQLEAERRQPEAERRMQPEAERRMQPEAERRARTDVMSSQGVECGLLLEPGVRSWAMAPVSAIWRLSATWPRHHWQLTSRS